MPQRNPRFKRLTLGSGLRAVLLLFAAHVSMTAGECTSINPQTFLDGAHGSDDRDSPLLDIDQLDAPGLVFVEDAGHTFTIEVRAEDADGDPMADTEARINAEFDPAMLELLHACGGNDQPLYGEARAECAGLVPAYHLFDNDGVIWFTFRALQAGETDVRFVYPGVLEAVFESDPQPTIGPRPDPRVGEYTDEAVTHVVIGGAPSDEDGDGIPDFEDLCPGTPDGTPVDEDGCPLPDEPEDSDGDGVVDEDDLCPGTPDGTAVDEDGCPLPDDEHPTLDQIAPGSYVFRGTGTSNACGFTNVSDEAAAATSNVGGTQPLKIQTFFPATNPGPAPTSTVQGSYDPTTGQYLATGTTAVGAEHDLEGVWTRDMNGFSRFEGELTERFLSPTCENTFDVTYSFD